MRRRRRSAVFWETAWRSEPLPPPRTRNLSGPKQSGPADLRGATSLPQRRANSPRRRLIDAAQRRTLRDVFALARVQVNSQDFMGERLGEATPEKKRGTKLRSRSWCDPSVHHERAKSPCASLAIQGHANVFLMMKRCTWSGRRPARPNPIGPPNPGR